MADGQNGKTKRDCVCVSVWKRERKGEQNNEFFHYSINYKKQQQPDIKRRQLNSTKYNEAVLGYSDRKLD